MPMLIEKILNYTEKKYGYLFFESIYDDQLKEIIKNNKSKKNNKLSIDVKIGDITSYSCTWDLIRRRIYVGSALKNIECNMVSVSVIPQLVEVTCKKFVKANKN